MNNEIKQLKAKIELIDMAQFQTDSVNKSHNGERCAWDPLEWEFSRVGSGLREELWEHERDS